MLDPIEAGLDAFKKKHTPLFLAANRSKMRLTVVPFVLINTRTDFFALVKGFIY
jgi:hypothetical protein